VVEYLRFINVAVGAFNLIPGFPLDGGRVLRAVLWKWQGDVQRATWLASRAGTAFAYGLMGLGVLQILGGVPVGGFWTILIGLFLRSAADASYAQVALREALGRLAVRDIMTRDVHAVHPDVTAAELGERFWTHHVTSFPVVSDGAVRGIASVHDLAGIPEERRLQARVGAIMRPLRDDLTARPGDSVVDAMARAARNGLGRLAVIDGGRLVGYLSLTDITHVMALRGLPRPADGDLATPAPRSRDLPRAA
jgi:CBS domain-containing protein